MPFSALCVTALNLASYLGLYTAYSKANKTLELDLLIDVIKVRKGIDHSLVEMNKAISLAGLTNLCLAPLLASIRSSLFWHAMFMLWAHSAYSAYKFYGTPHIPRIETWNTNVLRDFQSSDSKVRLSAIKKVALVFGSLGQILLAFSSLFVATLVASITHFYTIELDYKLSLKVRPYAGGVVGSLMPRQTSDRLLTHVGWRNECDFVACYADDSSLVDASWSIFWSLVVAWAACVAINRCRRLRIVYWAGTLCVATCAVQTYFVYRAANTVPASYNEKQVTRHDCLDSTKGGKLSKNNDRAPGSTLNPCFCHEYARCVLKRDRTIEIPSSECPTDETALCFEGRDRQVKPTLSSSLQTFKRDCSHGRGSRCSKNEPCTPCELDRLVDFPDASYCAMCTGDHQDDCEFKQGVGPYCYKTADSAEIEPCRRCCTEGLKNFTKITESDGNQYTVCSLRALSSS